MVDIGKEVLEKEIIKSNCQSPFTILISPPGKGTHGACDRSTGDAYSSYAPDLTSGISRGQCLPCTHFVLFFIYMYEIDQGSLSLP